MRYSRIDKCQKFTLRLLRVVKHQLRHVCHAKHCLKPSILVGNFCLSKSEELEVRNEVRLHILVAQQLTNDRLQKVIFRPVYLRDVVKCELFVKRKDFAAQLFCGQLQYFTQ